MHSLLHIRGIDDLLNMDRSTFALAQWLILLSLGATATIVFLFSRYAKGKFGYSFFGLGSTLCSIFGVGFIALWYWINFTHGHGRDHAFHQGWVALQFLVIGAGLLLFLVRKNFRRTNFVTGLTGTALQIALSPIMAVFGIVIAAIVFVLGAALGPIRPVYVINGLGENKVALGRIQRN
jgi:hypothetical protein